MSTEIQKVRAIRKSKGGFKLIYAYKDNVSRSVGAVTNLVKEIQKDFPSVSANEINVETFKGIACGVSLSFIAEETPRTVNFQTELTF